MPITFSCECGKKFQVKDEFAGKQTKCPVCSKALMIPSAGGGELELDKDDLVRPSERDKPKKSEGDVTLSEPASNTGLMIGGVVVAAGVIAFVVLLLGFLQGNGHNPYMLASQTPVPGNVVSTGDVKPIKPVVGIGGEKDGKNGETIGTPDIDKTLSEFADVARLAVSTDGRTAVTSAGKEVIIWDMATEKALLKLDIGYVCNGLLLDVSNLALLTVGQAESGGEAKLWDLRSGKVAVTVPLQSPIATLGFSDDTTRAFVSNPIDGTIIIDVANSKVGPALTNPWSKAQVAAFNIAKNQAAFAYLTDGANPRLEVLDLGSMKVVHVISTDAASGSMAYSNDGRWLVLASAKTRIVSTSWNETISIPRTISGQFTGKVVISADNRFVAGQTANGLVVWDLNARLDRVITKDPVTDLAFVANGRLVYTTGAGPLVFVPMEGE